MQLLPGEYYFPSWLFQQHYSSCINGLLPKKHYRQHRFVIFILLQIFLCVLNWLQIWQNLTSCWSYDSASPCQPFHRSCTFMSLRVLSCQTWLKLFKNGPLLTLWYCMWRLKKPTENWAIWYQRCFCGRVVHIAISDSNILKFLYKIWFTVWI